MNDLWERALWVGPSQPALDALEGAGFALCGRAADASEGLRLLRALEPELVLAEAVMPGADGERFARRAAKLPLNVRPALLILRLPCAPLLEPESLGALGAAAIDKPPTAGAIREAVAALRAKGPALPPEKAARLEAMLDALGVPAHPGRECLRAAVALAWADRRRLRSLGATLYPAAGALCARSGAQAERAIRHVIDAAWRTGDMAQQQKLFGDTIDARRGRPTCGEMIAQLADILRWEE